MIYRWYLEDGIWIISIAQIATRLGIAHSHIATFIGCIATHCRDKTNPMQRPLSCSGMALLQVREPRPDIVQSTTTVVLHREAHVFSSYHIHQNSNPNDSAR